jgi:hypothetical protein
MLTPENCGITQAHIQIIQNIAREYSCFIFVRQVNTDSTSLIEEGYKTKKLDIHAKSSNWGPMAGFICADENLSKVVDDGSKKLETNRHAIQKALRTTGVGNVQLMISRSRVSELINKNLFDEQQPNRVFEANSPKNTKQMRFQFEEAGDEKYRVFYWPEGSIAKKPLMVLGYKDGQMVVPVTADYDIFAICPHFSAPHFNIKNVTRVSDNGMAGVLSKFQSFLIGIINSRCGGNPVVNHGTELNNPFPEIDPNLAMFPPGGNNRLVDRLKLHQIYGDLTIRGFHAYVNQYWSTAFKAHIGSKMSRLRNPAVRGGKFQPEYLSPSDFNGLDIGAYDDLGSRSRAMQRFGDEVANNLASSIRPRWGN